MEEPSIDCLNQGKRKIASKPNVPAWETIGWRQRAGRPSAAAIPAAGDQRSRAPSG